MTVLGGVGASLVFSSASGGKVYGYNNVSEFDTIVVAQVNPSRQYITFHNPGAKDIFIGPVNIQNVLGRAPTTPSNVPLVHNNAALAGCFRVYANGAALVISGEC